MNIVFILFSWFALSNGNQYTSKFQKTSTVLHHLEKLDKEFFKNAENSDNIYKIINELTDGLVYNVSFFNHEIMKKSGMFPPYDPSNIPVFNCSLNFTTLPRKAKTVHELTAYDIEIVGAFGDSITAAFGALSYTLVDLFIEFRGISWSVGGDSDITKHVTIPNILKKFNTNIKGFSTAIAPPLIPVQFVNHLNKAVSGAVSYDLVGQAEKYVTDLITNPDYDFFGSWKLLTIFIGGNDLCSTCRHYNGYIDKYSPENFVAEIEKVLDYLHERVPKLFINLVNSPEVIIIQQLHSLKCDFTHYLECKCGSVFGEKARNFTHMRNEKYHFLVSKLIASGKYDTRPDFTVVVQPFLDNTDIPKLPDGSVDRSYFAPDCFHFSGKAHSAAAIGLWNNMLEPVGRKSKEWKSSDPFKCPSKDHPYFYTNLNSNVSM